MTKSEILKFFINQCRENDVDVDDVQDYIDDMCKRDIVLVWYGTDWSIECEDEHRLIIDRDVLMEL